MTRTNLGKVGILYKDANRLIDDLEHAGTEIHSLYAMRHGLPVLEGYWAPYGPGVLHGCQSLSKTVTGIALGTAMQEGILHLSDRLIDIFPEYAHHTAGRPYWNELQVRHIATMSAGMDTQPAVTSSNWIEEFFQTDIVHKPGTSFFYNSIACSMVGACIRRKTGVGLKEFLTSRVFCKIGVDPDLITWHCHPNGMENGSGGVMSTVRQTALLMELYRRGGVWNNERILSEEWVRFALQVQNPYPEGALKYGGMMWVWEHCFAADGAMGQWSLFYPEKDLVISVNQTLTGDGYSEVRGILERFAASLCDHPVEWTEKEELAFSDRISRLCIPHPTYGPDPVLLSAIDGKCLDIKGGTAHFFADDLTIFDRSYQAPVTAFRFEKQGNGLMLHVHTDGGTRLCPVTFSGNRSVYEVDTPSSNPVRIASVTGHCPDGHTLCLEVRWLESCRIHLIRFNFTGTGAEITTSRLRVGGFDVPDETVHAKWTKEAAHG